MSCGWVGGWVYLNPPSSFSPWNLVQCTEPSFSSLLVQTALLCAGKLRSSVMVVVPPACFYYNITTTCSKKALNLNVLTAVVLFCRESLITVIGCPDSARPIMEKYWSTEKGSIWSSLAQTRHNDVKCLHCAFVKALSHQASSVNSKTWRLHGGISCCILFWIWSVSHLNLDIDLFTRSGLAHPGYQYHHGWVIVIIVMWRLYDITYCWYHSTPLLKLSICKRGELILLKYCLDMYTL